MIRIITLLILLLQTGCVPMLIGGGTAVTALSMRQKGLGGTISDSEISLRVKKEFYSFNPEMQAQIGINVQNGEVLLTGTVDKPEWPEKAEELARKIYGVKNVMNHVNVVSKNTLSSALSSVPKDSWITTKIKSTLMFNKVVHSMNFSIKTVDCVVYLMGVASSPVEADEVVKVASDTAGVIKVVNYIQTRAQIKMREQSETNEQSEGDSNMPDDSSAQSKSQDSDNTDFDTNTNSQPQHSAMSDNRNVVNQRDQDQASNREMKNINPNQMAFSNTRTNMKSSNKSNIRSKGGSQARKDINSKNHPISEDTDASDTIQVNASDENYNEVHANF